MDFQVPETPEKSRTQRVTPPTPHPSTMRTTPDTLATALKRSSEKQDKDDQLELNAPSNPPQEEEMPKPKPKSRAVTQVGTQAAAPTKAGGTSSPRSKKPKKSKTSTEPLGQ